MLSGAAGVGEPNRKIYISRRKARNRHVVDEHAVERTLIARGFESVCFEDLSVAEQIALMRRAKTIVTTHGAALANTIFAPAGACVIEIFPRQRKNISLYASLSHALGLEHRVVLGDYTWRKNIRLDLGTLEVALEEALESHPAGQSPEFVA
jgi:capsular polysaccharide biosynthesis protein